MKIIFSAFNNLDIKLLSHGKFFHHMYYRFLQKALKLKNAKKIAKKFFEKSSNPRILPVLLHLIHPVRKLPDANDKTARDFKKFDGKNRFFSIFLKLSQTVSGDAKMVSKRFATLKATPKASGHILGSFEKNIFRSNSRPPEANFCLRGYFTF